MQDITFYQHHLNQVSRSFALVISRLRPESRLYISHAYLLFRVIDTIEDSSLETKHKINLLNLVLQVVEKRYSSEELQSEFNSVFTKPQSADETLMNDFILLTNDFFEFPDKIQIIISDAAKTMISGMINHLQLFENTTLRLKSAVELNYYCFFVAGVIGEMLTRLFSTVYKDPEFCKENLTASVSFGLFLQKINIIKDETEDKSRQVYYFDQPETIYNSIFKNIIATQKYIQQIPEKWADYKLFCLFSAGLGIISLLQKKLVNENQNIKVWTKTDVLKYFDELELFILKSKDIDLLQAVQMFLDKFNIHINPLDFIQFTNQTDNQNINSVNRYSLESNYFGIIEPQLLKATLAES